MVDSGSVANCIPEGIIEHFDWYFYLPRHKITMELSGIVPGQTTKVEYYVFLDLLLDSSQCMRKVPFLIVGANTDVLIGSNFIRSYQMNTYWVKKVLYATFGNPSLEPVELSFNTKDSRKGYIQPLDFLGKKNKDEEDIDIKLQHKPTLPPLLPPYFTQGPPPEDFKNYDITTTEDSMGKEEQEIGLFEISKMQILNGS